MERSTERQKERASPATTAKAALARLGIAPTALNIIDDVVADVKREFAADGRVERGLDLLLRGSLWPPEKGDEWLCASGDGTMVYYVNARHLLCNCPDAKYRGLVCKHVFAVILVQRLARPTGLRPRGGQGPRQPLRGRRPRRTEWVEEV